MRILFITDNFPPEVNAPASRTFEHCREWVRLGHEVIVVTCFPNFPMGKVYDGYTNSLYHKEMIADITVIRVWSYISANQGFLKRILDYISFMISATIISLKLGNFDKIIGTSPQFFSAVAAYLIGAIKFTPFIFELRDIWPESIRAVGVMKDSKLIKWFELIELYLYKRSVHIISVTHSFKENLVTRHIPAAKISVVRNGVDLSRFYPRPKDLALTKQLKLDKCFVAGYIGTHGMAHALETVLDAGEILQGKQDCHIKIILLGSGAQKQELIDYSVSRNLKNIIFIDTVDKSQVARYWSILDVCIVHLRDTPLFKTVIPSKIFESMGMGIPLIHCVLGESARIIENESIGWVIHPEDPQTLANAMIEASSNNDLLLRMANNCRAAAKKYERRSMAMKMINDIKSI
jgi:glycosyltransferase involved in cell wall biosynthesis